MKGRWFHRIAVALLCLAGLATVLAVGLWAFVHTPPGRRFVLDRLEDALPGVRLEAEGLGGSLFSALSLEGVTAHLPRGGAVRAERLDVHYSIANLLGARPAAALTLTGVRAGALRADLDARGPLEALAVSGTAHAGAGDVDVEGTVDALHDEAELDLRFDRFPVDTGQAAITLLATGTARLHAAPRGEALAFTATGGGSYRRRDGRQALGGGRFKLEAHGTQRDGRSETRFEIVLHDRGQAARVLDAEGVSPPTTVVRGELIVPPGGKPRLTADVAAR